MTNPDLTIVKKQLYVGCALTHAPQEFKSGVEALKKELGVDWHVMHFLGTTAGTAEDVYETDIIRNVGGCDAFVGVIDQPSWGLGYETARAVDLGKPVLIVGNPQIQSITRLALGAAAFESNFRFREYEDLVRDVPRIVREEFADVLAAA